MDWRRLDGYDWCILETPGAEPFIGLTIGYGLVHEPVQEFGTLQLLAGMLQAELSRPIETTPGRVNVPGVTVHVGTDTLDIGIRGDHDTVAATWKRLVETFAGSHPLDPAPPVGVQIQAAPRDLTSRFGMTSLSLGAADILDVHMAHDPVSLLRHLDPAAGNVRAVACTNFEELVGRHLPPPATPSPTLPTPSWLRLPMRSGGMRFPGGHAVISTVVPRTADGSAAIRVLLQQTAHHLSALTQRDDGVTASLIPVGPDVLATLLTSHDTLTPQQRSQIQQLLASRPIPDHRVHDAVRWEVAESPLSRTLERRVHGLPDDVDVTIDGTHRALALARSTLRFFTEEGSVT